MLSGLRLSRARLAAHHNSRRRLVSLHVTKRSLAHRVHVRLGPARADVLVLVLGHLGLAAGWGWRGNGVRFRCEQERLFWRGGMRQSRRQREPRAEASRQWSGVTKQ
eukprot:scaffold17197_cov101-Isochrysis_galbana.AAC.4